MTIDLNYATIINIIFIAAGLGICSMSIMQVGTGMHISSEVKKSFQMFFTMINIYISMHLLRMLMEGHTAAGFSIAIRAVTLIEFLVSGFMIYMLSLLIIYIAKPGKSGKVINTILIVLLVIHGAGLILNLFTGFYYSFDEFNVYRRGAGYALSNVMHILMLANNVFLLIKYRRAFDKRIASALWIYLLSPLAAIAIQIFFKDIQFIILATVLSAAYLNFVIIRIQTERYEHQQKEKERIDTELRMATRIQTETLPNIFPAFPERDEFNLFASMNPAKEVGGDFYDFFLIDDSHLAMVIADVSGKGVPAALFMMVSKILIQNIAMMDNSPAEVLRFVNNQVCTNNPEEMFVTVWYGCLDLETGKLVASNAGHEYPAFKKADGSFELVMDKHGFVVGGVEGVTYSEYELQMEPGSKLFIYTDGVPEATDANEEMFGTDRLINVLRANETESPQKIIKAVDEEVRTFVDKAPQFDDLTMLCLEYKGNKDTGEK